MAGLSAISPRCLLEGRVRSNVLADLASVEPSDQLARSILLSLGDLFGSFASLSPNAGASYAETSRAVPDYFVYQFMNQCYNRVYLLLFISFYFWIIFLKCLAVNRSD